MVVSAGSRREAGGAPQFQTLVALFCLGGDNTPNRNGVSMLEKARELLNLGLKATRKEVRAAYCRAARGWPPDRAPAGAEEPAGLEYSRLFAYQLIVRPSEV